MLSTSVRSAKAQYAGRRVVSFQRRSANSRTRTCKIQAKYGEDSVYFDLDDIENTTGNWDMYGIDDEKRYPEPQAAFFDRAADGLGRREAMYAFLGAVGGAGILVWGGLGSKQAKLPITIGPQKPPTPGPNGKI